MERHTYISRWPYLFNRDSDKTIYERLHKEFEAARALQTQGSSEYILCWMLHCCGLVVVKLTMSVVGKYLIVE